MLAFAPAGSVMRVKKMIAAVGAVVLAAIVVMAWIKGGAQPMRWIEQPVSAGATAQ
ncbi:hypothetical protein NVSP9465_01786 [Novosphingobium sp. CECT 9465]|nr:hypothetical protein NVSP9465_01786 [Novosphingobium sp. CECT 9465]